MPLATCPSCGARTRIAPDRVGGFSSCSKCGQIIALIERRVEPSAEHRVLEPLPISTADQLHRLEKQNLYLWVAVAVLAILATLAAIAIVFGARPSRTLLGANQSSGIAIVEELLSPR
jgi:hypothetical protein